MSILPLSVFADGSGNNVALDARSTDDLNDSEETDIYNSICTYGEEHWKGDVPADLTLCDGCRLKIFDRWELRLSPLFFNLPLSKHLDISVRLIYNYNE